jgi:ribosomal protein S1
VVSRRALLEEEQRASAEQMRQSLEVGAVMTGRVVSVRDFGAFVELGGGVQGLLHISEMGWSRVSDASNIVQVGDQVAVKILRVDEDKQKISLGLKQLTDDPWSKVQATYEAGQMRRGRVTRVAQFGAFVELEPGIEGLIPASESGVPRDGDIRKAFRIGTEVQVVVLDVDATARRIRLSINAVEQANEAETVREYAERPDAAPSESLGSLADKLRGALSRRDE